MKRCIFPLFVILVMCLFAGSGVAQTYVTVPLTSGSFNADIVVNGATNSSSPTPSSTASGPYYGADNSGAVFMSQDFSYNGTAADHYLPSSGTVSSASITGLTYQLASYSGNNSLELGNTGAGTLTFATPVYAGALYILGTSGSGTSTVSVTVNFSDASTQDGGSLSYPDWFSGGYEVQVGDRLELGSNTFNYSYPNPGLYKGTVTIAPSNYGKQIASLSITSTSGGYLNIMAVSASYTCAITGNPFVCGTGNTTTLSDIGGGTWSSTSTAVPVASSGVVTGESLGTAVISYTSALCNNVTTVTVSAIPSAISGTYTLCDGATTSLGDAAYGGTWSSSNAAVVSVDMGGTAYAISGGAATISYTLNGACSATQTITGSPPPIIAESNTIPLSGTTTLSDGIPGGTWSSNNTTVVTIDPTAGTALGLSAGTAVITYTSGSCYTTFDIIALAFVTPTCLPSTSSEIYVDCGAADYITSFSLGTLSDGSMPCGSYEDRRGITIAPSLAIGYSYTTTVNDPAAYGIYPNDNVTLAVWIDFNNDGTFQSSELVGGADNQSPGTQTFAVAIPNSGVSAGTYLMRVRQVDYTADFYGNSYISMDPCADYSDGEGLDYNVILETAPTFGGGSAQSFTVCENAGAYGIGSLLTITDPDAGQTETFTVTSGPSHGTVTTGSTVGSGTGVSPTGWSYTPTAGYSGSDAFTVQVSDGASGTASTVINVTVSPLPTVGTITGTATLDNGVTTTLADAPTSGTWSSANTAIASVDPSSGVVTGGATGGGNTIYYTVSNSCGTAKASYVIHVYSSVCNCY